MVNAGLPLRLTCRGCLDSWYGRIRRQKGDGYVAALEPATNFPNTRSFEESQGRVIEIAPGDTVSYRVTLIPLTNPDAVRVMSERIDDLQADEVPEIHDQPRPGWTPGA